MRRRVYWIIVLTSIFAITAYAKEGVMMPPISVEQELKQIEAANILTLLADIQIPEQTKNELLNLESTLNGLVPNLEYKDLFDPKDKKAIVAFDQMVDQSFEYIQRNILRMKKIIIRYIVITRKSVILDLEAKKDPFWKDVNLNLLNALTEAYRKTLADSYDNIIFALDLQRAQKENLDTVLKACVTEACVLEIGKVAGEMLGIATQLFENGVDIKVGDDVKLFFQFGGKETPLSTRYVRWLKGNLGSLKNQNQHVVSVAAVNLAFGVTSLAAVPVAGLIDIVKGFRVNLSNLSFQSNYWNRGTFDGEAVYKYPVYYKHGANVGKIKKWETGTVSATSAYEILQEYFKYQIREKALNLGFEDLVK